MTREEALHSYTGAAAFGAFLENRLGSLQPGRDADFVVLSENLLTCAEEAIMGTKVLQTWVAGEKAFGR
jgi:hypothetical protein